MDHKLVDPLHLDPNFDDVDIGSNASALIFSIEKRKTRGYFHLFMLVLTTGHPRPSCLQPLLAHTVLY
ncbi:trimethylguanosine synthase-like isoform X1 [Gossypium australe]|uniref:Trimethylguanosine synthase-like isoform X1 n=1 Tax=Gossypium australe TaxID=47621 RepID=A0A5B6W4B4_9ROSI|nr:trimethylguanosine synthase-like isoform X1 [Gossypium australe]